MVTLGRDICGHPRIVHGGLTAAIMVRGQGWSPWAWGSPGAASVCRAGRGGGLACSQLCPSAQWKASSGRNAEWGRRSLPQDETLGMLMFSLKRSEQITLPGPMFTVSPLWLLFPHLLGQGVLGPWLMRLRALHCDGRQLAWRCSSPSCVKHQVARTRACPPPPMQVQLDISYKAKIDAGAVVLCTAEVESLEGRKLWMKVGWAAIEPSGVLAGVRQPGGAHGVTSWHGLGMRQPQPALMLTVCVHGSASLPPTCMQATVSDGPGGTVYATARSLFIAPKPRD